MPDDQSLQMHTRLAPSEPATADAEALTVEAVVSTGADVPRRAPGGGTYVERLDLDGADLSMLTGGPVLDSHSTFATRDILGVVEQAERRGGAIHARLRFRDTDPGRAVFGSIQDGTLRSLSVGYSVEEWAETEEDGQIVRIARRWTPREVSVVAIPADAGAHFRHSPIRKEGQPMPDQAPTTPTEGQRAAPAAQTASPDTLAERERVRLITDMCRRHGLTDLAADMIADGTPIDAARAAVLDTLADRDAGAARRSEPAPSAGGHRSLEDPQMLAEAAGEAIFGRLDPRHELSGAARHFAHRSLPEIARDVLELRGVRTRGLSSDHIVTRALGGAHTTDDFPAILGNAMSRNLRRLYEAAPPALKAVARETSARDFRAKQVVSAGDGPRLERTHENGEFRYGTIAESAEAYAVETYGKVVALSRQAIVNDDLGAFDRLPRMFAQAATDLEAQVLTGLVENNPTMSDGAAVFSSTHGNLVGSGGVITVDSLGAARALMRAQTGPQGTVIGAAPAFLIVGPARETEAEQIVAQITLDAPSGANPFAGRLQVIVEPRLSDPDAWYLAADPALHDGLEFAYLEGQQGLNLETRMGFNVDGVEVRARMDFGGGWVDHRAWVKNPGA